MNPVPSIRIPSRRPRSIWIRAVLATFLLPVSLAAALPASGPEKAGPEVLLAPESGSLEVRIQDSDTGAPVAGAHVRISAVNRSLMADGQGVALFQDLPARVLTVSVERLGYLPADRTVEIREGERTVVDIALVSTPLEVAGIVVTGTGRERRVGDVYRPTTTMSGTELQRNLSSSVPATLERVPGFHVQYNGPGASSPSIRGMSGDRVLMLEDGGRTGDLYQTGSDHGVMVEPLTAQRMEVIRGPAGLLYGPNALGGVVNVIREDVPRTRPSRPSGTLSSQFESVNDGVGAAGVLQAPLGPLAVRGELSARRMGDTRTPLGPLDQTDMTVLNGSLGASLVGDRGYVGVAFRDYDSRYGVPGEFNGELIPGGHPGGVDIEVRRTGGRLRAAYQGQFLGFFEAVELDTHVTRYLHDEIEGIIGGQRVLGARFDQLSLESRVLAHHDHEFHDHPTRTLRAEGALGASFQWRDLTAGGASPGSRSGQDWSVSLFGYEEFGWEPFRLQAGLRWDYRDVAPTRTDSIVVRTQERRVTKPVTPRTFHGFSGSLAALWDFREGWTTGVSVARSFRNPSMEELYSDGPHLADFSFDIGSPDLDPEKGLGVDVFLRSTRRDLSVELAGFYNRVDDFIYYLQTGETVRVIREGARPRVTPVFEARGDDADFLGAEGRVQWEVLRRWVVDGTASYTRATRRGEADPLPFIPPLTGSFELRYEGNPFFASVGVEGARAQRRVPGPVEIGDSAELPQEPTPGYGLLNAGAGLRFQSGGWTHSLTLQARNLTDREWRDHLSRIKEIAPQPGRNVQLTYRVHF
jgi:iron complex outermembrane recepter protein